MLTLKSILMATSILRACGSRGRISRWQCPSVVLMESVSNRRLIIAEVAGDRKIHHGEAPLAVFSAAEGSQPFHLFLGRLNQIGGAVAADDDGFGRIAQLPAQQIGRAKPEPAGSGDGTAQRAQGAGLGEIRLDGVEFVLPGDPLFDRGEIERFRGESAGAPRNRQGRRKSRRIGWERGSSSGRPLVRNRIICIGATRGASANSPRMSYDAVIIGGSLAGAATATLLRRECPDSGCWWSSARRISRAAWARRRSRSAAFFWAACSGCRSI